MAVMLPRLLGAVVGLAVAGMTATADAATFTVYSSSASFEASLGDIIFDDYTSPGYLAGDVSDGSTFDRHTDSNMSSVLGETQYTTTSFSDSNMINSFGPTNEYCAGCNGSFLLDFISTSVTGANGVFGAGFGIIRNYMSDSDTLVSQISGGNQRWTAFVTFGDGTTANIDPPLVYTVGSAENGLTIGTLFDGFAFWAITSQQEIVSIHLGLPDGGLSFKSAFIITDLTIGSNPIPLPAALPLFATALAGMGLLGWRRKRKASV